MSAVDVARAVPESVVSQRVGSAYDERMVVWAESGVEFDRGCTARNTVGAKEEEVLACIDSVVGCVDDHRIRDCIAVGRGAQTASLVCNCTVEVLVNFVGAVGSVAVGTLCSFVRAAVEVAPGGRDHRDLVMANILFLLLFV